MTEKILHKIFTVFSVVIHFTILCAIISIPVFLIYQGETLPVFTASVGSVTDAASTGEDLPEEAASFDECSKIEISCTADAGRFNPYTFRVEAFENAAGCKALDGCSYVITCNDEVEFSGGPSPLSFTINVYVNTDTAAAENIAHDLVFHTVDTTEGFSAVSALIVNGYTFSVQ